MSRGLRYLMDRNRYHVVVCSTYGDICVLMTYFVQDNVLNGYSPPMTTVVILAVSIAVTYVTLLRARTVN